MEGVAQEQHVDAAACPLGEVGGACPDRDAAFTPDEPPSALPRRALIERLARSVAAV
jgi:hypothetical protein